MDEYSDIARKSEPLFADTKSEFGRDDAYPRLAQIPTATQWRI